MALALRALDVLSYEDSDDVRGRALIEVAGPRQCVIAEALGTYRQCQQCAETNFNFDHRVFGYGAHE